MSCRSSVCICVCCVFAFYPEIMFSIVKEQPYFTVSMWQENLLQWDDIGVLQLPQQLQRTNPLRRPTTQSHYRHHEWKWRNERETLRLFLWLYWLPEIILKQGGGHDIISSTEHFQSLAVRCFFLFVFLNACEAILYITNSVSTLYMHCINICFLTFQFYDCLYSTVFIFLTKTSVWMSFRRYIKCLEWHKGV